ncbi:MAG: hypothetical protein QY322_00275 [bacterium]|nr:MAG: hypothetical protein QY322_00275 [bacterium]
MPNIPSHLKPYLASYDLSQLDIVNDREIIITEILNKGDGKALRWLTENYSKRDIKNAVASPLRGYWMSSVLKYWLNIFEISLSKNKFEKAIISLEA